MENKIYNFQKALNYSTILKLVGYSLKRFWEIYPRVSKFVLVDEPITEHAGILSDILKTTEKSFKDIYELTTKEFSKVSFSYNIVTFEDSAYSPFLKVSLNPPLILFTRGNNDFMKYPAVSVVGTRHPSSDGIKRAQKLAFLLSDMGFIVASGLAMGIDTAAHSGTIAAGGRTMAVIGTTLSQAYPKENASLQNKIANEHLLISQFPFNQPMQKYNFPNRNQTMSGLSIATIIVEAGETSGALIQAQQCLRQKRKLFILKNLVDNPNLQWPKKYKDKEGVTIVAKIDDLIAELQVFKLVKERSKKQMDKDYDLFEKE